jgi:hypothetical protein
MKTPDWMFTFINPVMTTLLGSPAHGLFSDSILLVHFRGRKSGKSFVTPARYVRVGDKIRCYSTTETQWWKNLRDARSVSLTVAGKTRSYSVSLTENEPGEIRTALEHYFSVYPQDAAYHDVRIGRDGKPLESDMERAANHAIVVEAELIH